MFFVNSLDSVLSDLGNVFALIFLLTAFILYLLFVNDTLSATDRTRLISKLPSLTKNVWASVKLSLKLGFIKPRDILPFFDTVVKQNGPVVHFKLLTRNYVLLMDPDDIKVLLSSGQHITKGPDYRMLEPWLKEGLLISPDKKWHSRRKILNNSFHYKILETYIPSINRHSRLLVKHLIAASNNGNKPIADVEDHITLCVLDNVGETIMGVNLQTQEGKSIDYVEAIKKLDSIVIRRIFTFWYWNDLIFYLSKLGTVFRKALKTLHGYTENIIKERRKILENTEPKISEENERKRVNSFLDLLIGISKENPDTMTDLDIREEVDTFLNAAHDTSSITLTMAIIHLGLNQSVQDSVRNELYKIFGDSDRDATMEDLKAMILLDRVVKETMRLYPSVTGITRRLHEPLHLKNYTIPAKSIAAVCFHLLHRDEKSFPDPEKFDPDRFTPEQCAGRHPYAYLPFSAGPRNCIGLKFAMYQMKVVLSTVLRNTRIETLGKQSDIVISTQLVMRADHLPDVLISPIYDKNYQKSFINKQ